MRHLNRVKKLGRSKAHRELMIINQVKTLLRYGTLKTTKAKLKVAVSRADSLLSKVMSKDEKVAIRIVEKNLKDKEFAKFVVKDLKGKLPDKQSGFFNIYKLDFRKGDNADMALAKLIFKKNKKDENKTNKKK